MSRPKMTEEQKAAAKAEREAQRAEVPSLADYIKARESDDPVIVRVSYPGAEPHVFDGKFSGIAVVDGPLSCQWSDGRTE